MKNVFSFKYHTICLIFDIIEYNRVFSFFLFHKNCSWRIPLSKSSAERYISPIQTFPDPYFSLKGVSKIERLDATFIQFLAAEGCEVILGARGREEDGQRESVGAF